MGHPEIVVGPIVIAYNGQAICPNGEGCVLSGITSSVQYGNGGAGASGIIAVSYPEIVEESAT